MGIRKDSAEKFDREVIEMVQKLGAVLDEVRTRALGSDAYVIETKAGAMTIHPSTHPRRDEHGLYTVFCKFADVDQAKRLGLFGFNVYSGKYNFHEGGHDESITSALGMFRKHLELVMPPAEAA